MYFHIIRLRERGKSRDKKALQSDTPTAGDLRIEHQPTKELGRPSRVAFIASGSPDN